jgi:hypothetical protein
MHRTAQVSSYVESEAQINFYNAIDTPSRKMLELAKVSAKAELQGTIRLKPDAPIRYR